jgi:hypothetical protein
MIGWRLKSSKVGACIPSGVPDWYYRTVRLDLFGSEQLIEKSAQSLHRVSVLLHFKTLIMRY